MPVFHLRQLRFLFKVFLLFSCPLVCFGHVYVSGDNLHRIESDTMGLHPFFPMLYSRSSHPNVLPTTGGAR